jgi:hypothetical protein
MKCHILDNYKYPDDVFSHMAVKGTSRYYKAETKTGKIAGRITLKDNVASKLPFDNSEELYTEYKEETGELIIRKL